MNDVPVRALILDLGGVLLLFGPCPERERFATRLGATAQERYDALWSEANPYARQVLTGRIQQDEFWVRTGARFGLSREESLEVGRTFFRREYLNQELTALARCARSSRIRVGLLSNAMGGLDRVLTRFGVLDLFDSIVSSAEVGLIKPDPEIYTLACERLGVTPRESLFIDDQKLNTDAASALGMQALQYVGLQTVQQAADLLGLDQGVCSAQPG